MSEREKVWLNDHLSHTLATFIDGDRNIDEIIDIIQQSLLQDPKSLHSATTFFQEVLNVSIQAQYALLQMK